MARCSESNHAHPGDWPPFALFGVFGYIFSAVQFPPLSFFPDHVVELSVIDDFILGISHRIRTPYGEVVYSY